MLDSPLIRLLNNWLHDFSSGLWGSCVLVMWLLDRSFPDTPPDEQVSSILFGIQWVFWYVLLAALAVIALTGAVRLFHWRASTPAEEMPAKRRVFIAKHVAFLAVYGLGTWWAWSLF